MKKISAFMSAFLVVVMVLLAVTSTGISANAEADAKNEKFEIVILLDTSGSMTASDPLDDDTRVSTEAAKAFAFLYPSYSELLVDVIAYNTEAVTVLEDVNVCTEVGMGQYTDALDRIANNKLDELECYNYKGCLTDIGLALDHAKTVLSDSDADKKAVVLFTDGRIETKDEATSEASRKLALECRDDFAEAGIPIFTIGLDASGKVDRDFLEDLSDKTGGSSVVCSSTVPLIQYFQAMYADFFGVVQKTSGTDTPIEAGVEQTYEVDVYGGVVKEANITITSDVEITNLKVNSPNNVNVVNDKTICSVDSSKKVVNVKLLSPADGNWTINYTGSEDGTARIAEIHMYELEVKSQHSEKVVIGGNTKIAAQLYNVDEQKPISTQRVYQNTSFTVNVVDPDGLKNSYNGEINDSSDGFVFDTAKYPELLTKEGTYDFYFKIADDRVSAEGSSSIVVVNSSLAISAEKNEVNRCDGVKIFIQNLDPQTNTPVSFKGRKFSGTLTVSQQGKEIKTFEVSEESLSEDDETKLVISCDLEKSGEYDFTADIKLNGEDMVTDTVSVKFKASQISVDSKKYDDFEEYLSGGKAFKKYDLDKIFKDSDKDKLKYTVEIIGDVKGVTAEIDGNDLKITATAAAECKVKVTAVDGRGASKSIEIPVAIKSYTGIIIGIVIGAAVVILLSVIILIFIKKRSVIRVAFNINVTKENGANNESVVMQINRLSAVRNAKGKMNLKKILTNERFILNADTTTPEWYQEEFVSRMSGCFELKGMIFTNGFIINYKKGKVSKQKKFTSRAQTFELEGYTVSFGGRNAFLD